MKYRNCVYTMAAALLVACSLAVSGCSDKKTEELAPPAVSYGVVDLETLVKAHPKYSTYFRLETEYNHLLDQYQNERNKLIHIASQQQHIKAALSDQSRRMAAENEWKTKVKAKEDELNDGLAKLYKTISEAHKKDRIFTPDGLTDEERAEMANLQMKLTVLGVTGSEKEDVKQRLHDLMDLRNERRQMDTIGWTEDEVKTMKEAKEKASKELSDFSEKTAKDIKQNLAEETNVDEPLSEDTIGPSWNEDWQQKIDAKQKEMAAVKKEIMEDIRKEAAREASDKHLSMIFSKYKANIHAEDVTGDMVNRIVNITK